ncbi:MAG: hypothetical protein GEV13_16520 [Rhodospirillales bacterium]|nr:hypothetical protein [Rhodospirillales bacterium]
MTVMRLLIRLWAVAGGPMLGGCHYTEEEKWSVYCVLYIGRDTSGGRTKIIEWYWHTDFDANGQDGKGLYGRGTPFDKNKDDKIRADIADFLSVRPEGRTADYFIGLGMTCSSRSTASKVDSTQCEIELPVQVSAVQRTDFFPARHPFRTGCKSHSPQFCT